jgi:hypothetical protein
VRSGPQGIVHKIDRESEAESEELPAHRGERPRELPDKSTYPAWKQSFDCRQYEKASPSETDIATFTDGTASAGKAARASSARAPRPVSLPDFSRKRGGDPRVGIRFVA